MQSNDFGVEESMGVMVFDVDMLKFLIFAFMRGDGYDTVIFYHAWLWW